jgi:hypothetical protein
LDSIDSIKRIHCYSQMSYQLFLILCVYGIFLGDCRLSLFHQEVRNWKLIAVWRNVLRRINYFGCKGLVLNLAISAS